MNINTYLYNLQVFLSKFKKTKSPSANFEYITNPNVYSLQSSLPDLYLKTRIPFDKNQCFIRSKKAISVNMFPR